MALIVAISGSPSGGSRTLALTRHVAERVGREGHETAVINVRDLPAAALLGAQCDDPAIQAAVGLVERATAVIVATPVYKAAYSGVLKAFLDLLPQFGLAGKSVLPLATGGSLAHVLAIDYALRPVLASMGARHIVNGLFFLDKHLERLEPDGLRVDETMVPRLETVIVDLLASVRSAA